jgi:hypothetical protein
MTTLEKAKARTLKEISVVLRSCYSWNARGVSLAHTQWIQERHVKNYSQGDPQKAEECKALIQWAFGNPEELELYMAGRSPSSVSQWAVSHNRRLCREAEALVKQKAKDRSTLLDYCSHFGIVLDDLTKVTMKAAFEQGSLRETAYVKKIELTKKRTKEFLEQLVAIGHLDSGITVRQLIETL